MTLAKRVVTVELMNKSTIWKHENKINSVAD